MQARAELPLDADDPQRRQRGHHPQPRADGQVAVDRPRRGRSGQGARARGRARRGAVRGRRDRAAASTRASRARRSRSSTGPTRSRGCSRTRSCAREIGYQVIGGTKFYERAEIKDAIAYLTVLANPQDVVSFTRVANSPKRGIGQTSLSRVLAHAETMGVPVWDAAADPARGARARHGGACGPSSASWRRWRALRERAEQQVADRRPARGRRCTRPATSTALEAERTIEAQGRIENLAGARRGRARVRRGAPSDERRARRSSSSRSRSSPTPTRAATTRAS